MQRRRLGYTKGCVRIWECQREILQADIRYYSRLTLSSDSGVQARAACTIFQGRSSAKTEGLLNRLASFFLAAKDMLIPTVWKCTLTPEGM